MLNHPKKNVKSIIHSKKNTDPCLFLFFLPNGNPGRLCPLVAEQGSDGTLSKSRSQTQCFSGAERILRGFEGRLAIHSS